MKKLSMIVGAITLTSSLFAQDLTSKKGEAYLPKAGDWAIGIDAAPYLNYVGNFFGKAAANVAPTWGYATTNNTITGKYFVEDMMAYRGSLRLGFGSNKMSMMVADRSVDPATAATYPNEREMVENSWKGGATNIALAGGLEWRKGSTRLQGFYGAELGFSMSSGKNTYTYGNALKVDDDAATVDVTVDAADAMGAGTNVIGVFDSYGQPARITESKTSMLGVGVRGFIGAEYFVLPKLSVGGEFGWGLMFTSMKGEQSMESTGPNASANNVVGSETKEGPKESGFGIDTDAMNSVFGGIGQLRITLHF